MERKIKLILKSRPTMDGAGVHLNRVFGNSEVPNFDPFLLLDAFGSKNKSEYIKGFPWHPHRGIETITYLLKGSVEHGDSMGNSGVIATGDVQWMTAGSGIIHQEMPKGNNDDGVYGFQLWANLPKSHKMMPPRYQEIKSSEIPEIITEHNVKIKIICGTVNETSGPVKDIVTNPEYLDISIPSETSWKYLINEDHCCFAYVYEGSISFSHNEGKEVSAGSVVLFEKGDSIEFSAKKENAKFILISGMPIGEPIAWYGPIVMNTDEEIDTAFEEYNNGTFVKK